MKTKRNISKISEKRKENLRKSFDWIDFNFSKAKCTIVGHGDKPQFAVPGTMSFEGRDIQLTYVHGSPGGGKSRLVIEKPRYKSIAPAPQYAAKELKRKIIKIIKEMAPI